jgi:hypothetical protein
MIERRGTAGLERDAGAFCFFGWEKGVGPFKPNFYLKLSFFQGWDYLLGCTSQTLPLFLV